MNVFSRLCYFFPLVYYSKNACSEVCELLLKDWEVRNEELCINVFNERVSAFESRNMATRQNLDII